MCTAANGSKVSVHMFVKWCFHLFWWCDETLSYHVLVSICPVLLLALVTALQPLVGDGVPVDGRVVNHTWTLPHHHDGRIVLGVSLNILWLWAAGWRWQEKKKKKELISVDVAENSIKSLKKIDEKHERKRYNSTCKHDPHSATSHIKFSVADGKLMSINCTENGRKQQ